MSGNGVSPDHVRRLDQAFSLVELLVVVTILAILVAITLPFIGKLLGDADRIACLNKMTRIGRGVHLFAADQEGKLPRSFHSSGAHREPNWAVSTMPYLGISEPSIESDWPGIFEKLFRCPADPSRDATIYSYGMNVHFELDPDGDDYVGSPTTWRTLPSIPRPSRTILLAESRPIPFGDHLMCHQWSTSQAARNALAHDRHNRRSHFLFADGHVELLLAAQTLDPIAGINLWNPSLAR